MRGYVAVGLAAALLVAPIATSASAQDGHRFRHGAIHGGSRGGMHDRGLRAGGFNPRFGGRGGYDGGHRYGRGLGIGAGIAGAGSGRHHRRSNRRVSGPLRRLCRDLRSRPGRRRDRVLPKPVQVLRPVEWNPTWGSTGLGIPVPDTGSWAGPCMAAVAPACASTSYGRLTRGRRRHRKTSNSVADARPQRPVQSLG